ncbi:hypothetical protein ACJX0J_026510, partial [Zea mays]
MADLLNVSLGKNAEELERFIASCSNMVSEVDLNITETEKEIEISDSIDKMVQDLLDSESDKEKMLVYNKKEDLRREKKYSLRNKNKKRVKKRETPELLTLLSGHQLKIAIFNSIIELHGLIDLDLNNPTFEKLDRFLLEIRRVLIFGKKKLDIKNESENLSDREKNEKMEIHSLLDNGRLVDNEDEINKISGILLKRIFGICVMIFKGNLDIKRLNYGVITLIPKVDNAMEMKNFRPICLLNVIFENIFLIVLLLFMKLFMKFWRQMENLKFILIFEVYCFGDNNNNKDEFGKKEISLECPYITLLYMNENPTEDKSFSLWHGNVATFTWRVIQMALKSNHYWLNDCCFNNISPPNAANIGLYQKPVGIMLESGVIQNMYGWLASIPFLLESHEHSAYHKTSLKYSSTAAAAVQ